MKLRLLAVASAAIFFDAVFFFHPSVPLAIGVLLPSVLLSAYLLTVYWNAAVSGSFKPVSADREGDRLQKLNSDAALVRSLHFQKVDSYIVPSIPDCLVLVFMHPSECILAVVRLSENGKTREFISFFEGSDLTTASDAGSGTARRSVRHPLQVFRNADTVTLLNEHREAIRFLETRGSRPRSLPASAVRKVLLIREKELNFDLRENPFWPFELLFGAVRGQGGRLTIPLKERPEFNKNPPAIAAGGSGGAVSPAGPRYRVVFRGAVREGFTVPEVKDNLSRKFRLDAAKTDTLFAGSPVLIRSDVDEALARKVRDAFYGAGALCLLEIQPAAAVQPDAAGEKEAASLGAGGQSAVCEDAELQKFQIQQLLLVERSVLEKDFKASETSGWSAYALALSSFIPIIGIVTGPVSIATGLSKRRAGGMKVALIGFAGLVFSLMGGVTDFYVKAKKQAGVFEPQPALLTKKRLNDLARRLETYRENNGIYPESLNLIQSQPDTTISILDPMDPRPVHENQRRLAYEPDPSGLSYRLYSAGADGLPGTRDDIFPDLHPEDIDGAGDRQ
jgi:hypothetical protein